MIGDQTVVCLGGTFNRLHAGHRLLFQTAFGVGDLVRVGVTSDALVRRLRGPAAGAVRPYEERAQDVRRLLAPFGEGRFDVVPLEDPLAPVERPEFDAIVVSTDTQERAFEINAMREARGRPALKVVVVPILQAFDGKPLSATRILKGETDEEGRAVGPRKAVRARAGRARATGTKGATKRGAGRSSARTGNRAHGPRARR